MTLACAAVAAVVAAGQGVAVHAADAAPIQASSPPQASATAQSSVPHGPVIVTLKDQHLDLPATRANVGRRRTLLQGEQNTVLTRDGVTTGAGITHFSLVNAVSLTVTGAQAAQLAADPAVKSIVADVKVPVTVGPGASTPSKGPKNPGGSHKASSTGVDASDVNGRLCPTNPNKPLLEPEALTAIHAASPHVKQAAQTYATGAGVRVAVFAEAIDPTAPDYIRPDGHSAIVDYQDFSDTPDSAAGEAYGEEIFGDASSIAAQGTVVHDLSTFVSAAHPLPKGCNIQIRGVAPGADVVALKVLSNSNAGGDYALASVLAQAIDYAVTVDHVDVLSESLGAAGTPDSATQDAVQEFNDLAYDAGVTVVAGTGDAGPTGTILNPAADPKVISAAASTTLRAGLQTSYYGTTLSNGHWVNGNISPFSSGGFTSSGNVPVLTAPGDSGWAACTTSTAIATTCSSYSDDSAGNPTPSSIELFGGTSQATPFIAATAALVIQAYRDAHHGTSPSPELVRQILTSTADDLGANGALQGAGQTNALSAVKLAMAYQPSRTQKGAAKPAFPAVAPGSSLLLSTDQIVDAGAQGTRQRNTVTITNTDDSPVTVRPTVRQLVASAAPTVKTVTMNASKDPSLTGPTGVTAPYKTTTFKVKAGTDALHVSLTYPSAAIYSTTGAAQVWVALLDPQGNFVLSSRPQGGQGSGNYGNLDVARPQAGTWTAVLSSTPTVDAPLGTSDGAIPVPPFSGPVELSATPETWISAGTVSPATAKLGAGKSTSVVVNTRLPIEAGDSVLTFTPGASAADNDSTVSIVQRVLVSTVGGRGQFSGGLIGGNGRAAQPSQQQTYAVDVPAGQPGLNVALKMGASNGIPATLVSLIDPNGQPQAIANNGDATVPKAAVSRTVVAQAADPIPGRWRIIVQTMAPATGVDLVVPFTGTVTFAHGSATSTGLAALAPSATATALPSGEIRTLTLSITNTTGAPQTYYADPRTTQRSAVDLGAPAAPIVTPEQSYSLTSTNYLIPPDTTTLTADLTSKSPLQTQIAEPGSGAFLTGPDTIGPAARPVNGTAESVATLSVPSGALPPGGYNVTANQVGPYGPNGTPVDVANGTVTATTLGFDSSIVPQGGDPFIPGDPATDANGKPTATGVTIPAGQTGTLKLQLQATGSVGATTSGVVNVVQGGGTTPFTRAQTPGIFATDQVIATFPYQYKVAAGTPGITGTVDDSAGNGVAGAQAEAFDSVNGVLVGKASTDARGAYAINNVAPGTYTVCFDTSKATDPSGLGYAQACYKNRPWDGTATLPADAATVTVPSDGSAVTGVNETLTAGAGLRGTDKSKADGTPLTGMIVSVFAGQKLIAQTSTGSDGTYKFGGLAPGDYIVCTYPHGSDTQPAGPNGNWQPECDGVAWGESAFPSTPAYPTVTARSGGFTTVDFTLPTAAALTGTVSMPAGATLTYGYIVVLDPSTGKGIAATATTKPGAYSIPVMVPGTYDVCYESFDAGLDSQCYKDQPWTPGNVPPAGASESTLAQDTTTSGVDFALAPPPAN
ncbi:carboxypeptidase regulatory-like domain-containing protein [Streptomyces sp. NPDC093675]|uniref:carboxypeptidase regulatory-like domain-containing protein n=1 Tax=Streptomyces sp. NPDC093675 TaxID=3366049 RepID=UPI0037F7FB73